jgi:hypothetical protein
MTPEEIIARVKNGQKFAETLRPPGDLTPSQTADWQIIANAALGLLHQIEERCPSDPLQVEAVMFVLRTLSVVSGAFTVSRRQPWNPHCDCDPAVIVSKCPRCGSERR